jgi:hypothetical protein
VSAACRHVDQPPVSNRSRQPSNTSSVCVTLGTSIQVDTFGSRRECDQPGSKCEVRISTDLPGMSNVHVSGSHNSMTLAHGFGRQGLAQ